MLESFTRAVLLNPGQSRTLILPFSSSALASLLAGNYFPTIEVSVSGTAYTASATGVQSIEVSQ